MPTQEALDDARHQHAAALDDAQQQHTQHLTAMQLQMQQLGMVHALCLCMHITHASSTIIPFTPAIIHV